MAHEWVNDYQHCQQCNYVTHRCYFCGEDLDHVSYDVEGNLHDVAYCRPDLVPHEPGPLCTWPSTGDPVLDEELARPECYWDHENNRLKEM